ncbi:MAG: hypothetical protein ABW215_10110 [Kibdelosporangium sp.]
MSPEVEVAGARAASWAIGAVAVTVAVTSLLCLVPALRHWLILPVATCGILVAPDVVDWSRKRLDTFDPQAILALVGAHFFFFAPLLHVTLDYWPRFVPPSTDWRAALGDMAWINVVGLLIYRCVLASVRDVRPRPAFAVDRDRMIFAGGMVFAASLVSFVALVASFGGLGGYVGFMTSPDRDLTGYGLTVLTSSAFPLVGLTLVLVRWRTVLRRRPHLLILLVVVFVLVQFVAGGLRGSRGSLIWPVLIALALCHLIVVPLRRRILALVLLAILGFMYVYGFYKSVNSNVLDIFTGAKSVSELAEETGRDIPGLLLGDLARADIQALVLERQRGGTAPLGHGISYLGDVTSLIPRGAGLSVPGKSEIGTDMFYGAGTFDSGFRSSRIYGLAGEATLNFGAVGGMLSFLPLGLVVRAACSRYRRARGADSSLALKLLAPAMSISVVLLLTSDLDNFLWFVASQMFALLLVVGLARHPTAHPHGRWPAT